MLTRLHDQSRSSRTASPLTTLAFTATRRSLLTLARTLVMPAAKRPGRTAKRPVDYNEDAQAAVQAADVGGSDKRRRTSGWKELDGQQPYRSDFASGVHATVTAPPDPSRVPKRNAKGELVFAGFSTFRPNLTPEQVIRLGAFGGTYWRPITSGVTGETHKDAWLDLPDEWFKGVPKSNLCASWSRYDTSVNHFGVNSGGSLDMWESSGWISDIDPYGWFQWYCWFYLGRRSTDDERQVSRWAGLAGPKGRFRNQLIGRCANGGTTFDDATLSPVIRQSLLHWGKLLTEEEAEAYVKLKGLPKLKKSATGTADLATVGLPEGRGKGK